MKKGNLALLIVPFIAVIIIVSALLIYYNAPFSITSYQAYQSFNSQNPITIKLYIIEPEQKQYEIIKFKTETNFDSAPAGYEYGCVSPFNYNSGSEDCRRGGYQDRCSGSAPSYCQPSDCGACWRYKWTTSTIISCSIEGTKVFEINSAGVQSVGTNYETINLASYFNKYIPVGSENIVYMTCQADANAGSIKISPEPSSREIKMEIVPVCTEGASQACSITNNLGITCSGTQICSNNAWGLCKTLAGCGVINPINETKPIGCNILFWYDDTNKDCGSREFCGAYAYLGLHTFDTKEKCLADLPVQEVTPQETPKVSLFQSIINSLSSFLNKIKSFFNR